MSRRCRLLGAKGSRVSFRSSGPSRAARDQATIAGRAVINGSRLVRQRQGVVGSHNIHPYRRQPFELSMAHIIDPL